MSTLSSITGRHPRRLSVKVGTIAAAAAALVAVTAAEAQASSYPVKIGNSSVTLRDCYHPVKQPQPSQSCTAQATLPAGTPVTLICQHEGQSIYGDVWWNYVLTPNNGYGYVSDYYVNTGQSAYRVPGVDYCNY